MTVAKARILVVDDEQPILSMLSHHLKARGFEVSTASSGREAIIEVENNPPHLIILDLMMPDMSGLEVTSQLRTQLRNETPIIVLSARGEERQKVEALEMGADDYLTKPFGLDELVARIRVALRHSQSQEALIGFNQQAQPNSTIIGSQSLNIDLTKHQVWREGKEIKLSPKQYELLKYMALNEGKLMSHRMLLREVWGREYGSETQYLHVYIGQLRQKLEIDQAKPQFIITEPGLGYRFLFYRNE